MNIDPTIWGSCSWKFMHYITMGYPEQPSEEVKKNTYNFYISLKYLLPCEKCRSNFSYHLTKHPLTDTILSSKNNLINWLIDIHNEVNISIGKPTMTYNEALDIYKNENQSYFENIDLRMLTVIITIILILLIIIVIKFRYIIF